jgi:hypothetical protein
MCVKTVIKMICELNREEVTEGWRKVYNEELRNLYSLTNIIKIIVSRSMRWAGYVARMGDDIHKKFQSENLKGRDHVET